MVSGSNPPAHVPFFLFPGRWAQERLPVPACMPSTSEDLPSLLVDEQQQQLQAEPDIMHRLSRGQLSARLGIVSVTEPECHGHDEELILSPLLKDTCSRCPRAHRSYGTQGSGVQHHSGWQVEAPSRWASPLVCT